MQTIFTCFSQNLNYALGWMVVHSVWQATLIAFVSGIAAIVLRKKSARLRYFLHNGALVTVLLAAVVTFSIYYDFSINPLDNRLVSDELVPVCADNSTVGITQIVQFSPVGETEGRISMDGFKD